MNKKEKIYYSLAFSKQTPTAFIVGSPFQLLCAWNAIEEFEIKDYKIILVLERKDVRNPQTLNMLESRGMSYEIYYAEDFVLQSLVSGQMPRPEILYKRIMVGEILDYIMLALAGLYAAQESVLVYMDDGAASIRVLTGHAFNETRTKAWIKSLISHKSAPREELIKTYWSQVGLHDCGYYYTIYADIPTRRYITYPNKFDKLSPLNTNASREEAVLIIGALSVDYVEIAEIYMKEYEDMTWAKLQEVKRNHSNDRIIYVPHGRDNNEAIKQFCETLGIEYTRPNMALEIYVLSTNLRFTHIYGFHSTAHYTLKLLTNAQVTTWLLMKKLIPAWYSISEIVTYYHQHGIQIDQIPYPKPTCRQYISYHAARVANAFKGFCKKH